MKRHAHQYQQHETQIQKFRLSLLFACLIILALILILRLAYLQFSQYKRYATLSLKNQMSILPIAPPRGLIVDRNGVIIADNIAVYVLDIIPERVHDLQKTLQRLQKLIPSITDDDINLFNHVRKSHRSYESIPFKLKLTQEEVAIFASNQYQFPGVSIKARLIRYYPLKDLAAHVLGYVGRINVQELQNVDYNDYRASNFIGKAGIEKYYEHELHGHVGYQQVETDVSGRTIRVLSKQPPQSGAKITLTIDTRLQKIAHDALLDKRGAVVLMKVNNGEILAMNSSPSFDPNLFVNGISQTDYQLLSNEQDRPLYNRAVRGLYPPASTVKPFLAIAGLDKEVINTSTHIYDPGWYKLPGVTHSYRDWKHTGHGIINVKRAITVSCDTFFYQLGNKMGISVIEDILTQFGFGQFTHIDLNEEAPGLVPSPNWKRQSKGLPWYPGDTLITSIGQGFMLASPLQLANATASMSQHGQRYRPHLLRNLTLEGTPSITKKFKPIEEYPVKLKNPENWDVVINAMHAVIISNEGTGARFGRNAPYSVAAKTGTAQVFSLSQDEKKTYQALPQELRDHSLFIAFAPVEKPEVAIAVLVEHDTTASNVARQILDAYFQLENKP
jgi:penicillin-binding protein 2